MRLGVRAGALRLRRREPLCAGCRRPGPLPAGGQRGCAAPSARALNWSCASTTDKREYEECAVGDRSRSKCTTPPCPPRAAVRRPEAPARRRLQRANRPNRRRASTTSKSAAAPPITAPTQWQPYGRRRRAFRLRVHRPRDGASEMRGKVGLSGLSDRQRLHSSSLERRRGHSRRLRRRRRRRRRRWQRRRRRWRRRRRRWRRRRRRRDWWRWRRRWRWRLRREIFRRRGDAAVSQVTHQATVLASQAMLLVEAERARNPSCSRRRPQPAQ